jgi:hypothetical protein
MRFASIVLAIGLKLSMTVNPSLHQPVLFRLQPAIHAD